MNKTKISCLDLLVFGMIFFTLFSFWQEILNTRNNNSANDF